MSLVFMIFIKELTSQIKYPEPGYLLTVHSQVDGSVCMLTAFDSGGKFEEQDDGFLG